IGDPPQRCTGNCEFVCNGPCESASKFGVGGRNNRFRSNGDTSQGLGWPSTKNGAEKYQLRFAGEFSRRTALGRRSVRGSTCWFQRSLQRGRCSVDTNQARRSLISQFD